MLLPTHQASKLHFSLVCHCGTPVSPRGFHRRAKIHLPSPSSLCHCLTWNLDSAIEPICSHSRFPPSRGSSSNDGNRHPIIDHRPSTLGVLYNTPHIHHPQTRSKLSGSRHCNNVFHNVLNGGRYKTRARAHNSRDEMLKSGLEFDPSCHRRFHLLHSSIVSSMSSFISS